MDGNSGGGSSEDESEQAHFHGEMQAEITKQELSNVVKTLSAKLEDLTTCSNLIGKKRIEIYRLVKCCYYYYDHSHSPENAQITS